MGTSETLDTGWLADPAVTLRVQVVPATAETPSLADQLRAITDPLQRAQALTRVTRALAAETTTLAPERQQAVVALYDGGERNLAGIGRHLGISRERVRELLVAAGRLDAGGNGRRKPDRHGDRAAPAAP